MPDRSGPHGVGEAEPDPADHRGAAVGAHDQQPARARLVLEPDLLLDRHVVAEEHHGQAGLQRVHRLGERVRAGHRDQREVRAAGTPGGRRRSCAAAARCRPARRSRSRRPTTAASAASSAASAARDRVVVVGADRDHQVVGPGAVRRGRSPCRRSRSRLSSVPIATSAACTPSTVDDGPADLHQGDRVVVGAAADLDGRAGAHHATWVSGRSARRVPAGVAASTPCARAVPEVWPTASSRRGRLRRTVAGAGQRVDEPGHRGDAATRGGVPQQRGTERGRAGQQRGRLGDESGDGGRGARHCGQRRAASRRARRHPRG